MEEVDEVGGWGKEGWQEEDEGVDLKEKAFCSLRGEKGRTSSRLQACPTRASANAATLRVVALRPRRFRGKERQALVEQLL